MTPPLENFYFLVKGPENTTFDADSTALPIAPFESGFLHFTDAQIQDFVLSRLTTTPKGTNLCPNFYAYLDEKSEATDSVVFGAMYNPEDERDIDEMTEEEHEEYLNQPLDTEYPLTEWKQWRIPFADADKFYTLLTFETDTTRKVFNDRFLAKFTDGNGVFQAKQAIDQYVHGETRSEILRPSS